MTLTGSKDVDSRTGGLLRILTAERLAIVYGRIALGAAFLSAVADRFGLWESTEAGEILRTSRNTRGK